MKCYNITQRVGGAKYVVSFHDGSNFHKDGSPFFDIRIFKSIKKLNEFVRELKQQGYNYN